MNHPAQTGPAQHGPAQYEALLKAAVYLLGARQDRMLGLQEWVDLAKAAAACQSRLAAEYLLDRDLECIALDRDVDWDEATDGALPHAQERPSDCV